MNARNQNEQNAPGAPAMPGLPGMGNPNELLKQMGFQMPEPIVLKDYTQKYLEAFMYF